MNQSALQATLDVTLIPVTALITVYLLISLLQVGVVSTGNLTVPPRVNTVTSSAEAKVREACRNFTMTEHLWILYCRSQTGFNCFFPISAVA